MKRSIFAIIILAFMMSACMKDTVTEHYTFFRPVYQSKAEIRAGIKSSAAIPVEIPGKIVVKDHYVFLNDLDKGIHIIDIADPAKPVNLAFIAIPGCIDLAIYGSYLYADCYTTLVTIDISNPLQVSVKQFLNGVFPERFYNGFKADSSMIIKEWVKVDTAVSKRFSETLGLTPGFFGLFAYSSSSFSGAQSSGPSAASAAGAGISGSMARFGLLNKRLYTVSKSDLKVFNIVSPDAPVFVSVLPLLQGNIETIFPYQNNLFIGSQTGMNIYDAIAPDQPKKLSQFTHVRSCDPVIADGNYAYVTLHGGGTCGGTNNQLDVVDITKLNAPALIATYPLSSPEGLSKDGNLLLICDGKQGLKIFDASKPAQVTLIKQVAGFQASDVIALQGIAIATAKDGIYFIDYSDPKNAAVMGKIAIARK